MKNPRQQQKKHAMRCRLREAMARQEERSLRGEPGQGELLGWVARDGLHYLCDQQACMVLATEERLRRLTALMSSSRLRYSTIGFEEMLNKMHSGAVFALDDGICEAFLAFAMTCGVCPVVDQTIEVTDLEIRLSRVSLILD
jgi:hypothetical protein